METKIIAYILIGVFGGPVAAIVLTPIVCLLRKIFFIPFIRKSLREKAERKGHVVEAHLLKSHNIRNHNTDGVPLPTMEDMGIYSYEVNGKTYRYRLLSTTGIPQTIRLYYIKKPRKATLANDLGNWETPWFKLYLVISLLAAVAIAVIGPMIG